MRFIFAALVAAGAAFAVLTGIGSAAPPSSGISVTPWLYQPDLCPGIVAQWDYDVGNPAPSLNLNKPCPTATEAASGATIDGVSGMTLTELNFDYMGYCGAGAPRFNVTTTDNVTHFFGCIYGTHTDLGNGWTHVVFSPTDAFPPVTPGEVVQSIEIVQDEHTDATGVYLDNISVNDQVVGGPTAAQGKAMCKNGGWQDMTDDAGHAFKNQGDCVSFFATAGKNRGAGS